MCELYFLRDITSLQNRLLLNQVAKFSTKFRTFTMHIFQETNPLKFDNISRFIHFKFVNIMKQCLNYLPKHIFIRLTIIYHNINMLMFQN